VPGPAAFMTRMNPFCMSISLVNGGFCIGVSVVHSDDLYRSGKEHSGLTGRMARAIRAATRIIQLEKMRRLYIWLRHDMKSRLRTHKCNVWTTLFAFGGSRRTSGPTSSGFDAGISRSPAIAPDSTNTTHFSTVCCSPGGFWALLSSVLMYMCMLQADTMG
jgi:hypothetical protein